MVNCARGGLIDEDALLGALEEGRVAGAALDVLEEEPPPRERALLRHPRVVITPHLGASTTEAQRRIALEIAGQVLAALDGHPVKGAVNAPVLQDDAWVRLGPFLDLMRSLGTIARQLVDGQVHRLEFAYEGEIAAGETEVLQGAFLSGLLATILDRPVNVINAATLARERGIAVAARREERSEDFSTLIRVRLETAQDGLTLGGTLFGRREPRIVQLDGYRLDLAPARHMLWVWNDDRPGMIGKVGTVLGNADVNIASMQVGRDHPRGRAVMVLGLDDPVPEEVLETLRGISGIVGVKSISGWGDDGATVAHPAR